MHNSKKNNGGNYATSLIRIMVDQKRAWTEKIIDSTSNFDGDALNDSANRNYDKSSAAVLFKLICASRYGSAIMAVCLSYLECRRRLSDGTSRTDNGHASRTRFRVDETKRVFILCEWFLNIYELTFRMILFVLKNVNGQKITVFFLNIKVIYF